MKKGRSLVPASVESACVLPLVLQCLRYCC